MGGKARVSLMSLTAMERIQVRVMPISVSSNSDNQLEQGKSFFSLVSNLVASILLLEGAGEGARRGVSEAREHRAQT